jgi:hypothetical protein
MTVTRPLAALMMVVAVAACSPGQPSGPQPSAGPVVLDVTIFDGHVTPRGARVNLTVGQPLTLSIRSDAAETIHIHTDPERTFRVRAGKQQRVTFSVDRPGKVAVEVHHLDAVVAEVLVRK